jgi:hypothetical protein
MAEKKKSRADKMYGDSPSLKRDEEDGKMKATKPSHEKKKADEVQGGIDGAEREGEHDAMPHHVRHAHERHAMHVKHEHEHRMHDEGEHGSKKEMHKRHRSEMKSMHSRHEKEMGHDGEEMIHKAEETEKEEE